PVGTPITWWFLSRPRVGPLSNLLTYITPDRARVSLYVVDALHTLVVMSALGMVVYALAQRAQRFMGFVHPDLSALIALIDRRKETSQLPTVQMFSRIRAIAMLIAATTGLQSFDWSFVMTGGGPANATMTPAFVIYGSMFRPLKYGYASAQATV